VYLNRLDMHEVLHVRALPVLIVLICYENYQLVLLGAHSRVDMRRRVESLGDLHPLLDEER
jgi:hypothetical protein